MSTNPYEVVGAPTSYQAPSISQFFQNGQQKQGQKQDQQQNTSLMSALQKFLNSPGGPVASLPPGSAIPGAVGPTSVGGAPLMQSGAAPMINPQGMGFY